MPFPNNEPGLSDSELNNSHGGRGDDNADFDEEAVLRSACIDDYCQETLRGEDSLESALGRNTGGLLKFTAMFEQAILKLLAKDGDAICQSREFQRVMTTFLALSRQLGLNINLVLRLIETRTKGKSKHLQQDPLLGTNMRGRSHRK